MSESQSPRASTPGYRAALRRWLNEHLGISEFTYAVPAHANRIWYVLGGTSFVGFIVLILSGIWLTQFYHPHPPMSYGSVLYIMNKAPGGNFIRSLHYWSANLVFVTVLLHMIRVFITASYKHPREINWLTGLGLLGLTFLFIFTGTVLKWDQEGYEALEHNIEVAEILGRVGGWFSPEFTESVPLLVRLYIAHVNMLLILLFVLLAVHFFLLKHHGISPPSSLEGQPYDPKTGTSTFASHLGRMLGYGLLVFVVLAGLLALVQPAPLGPRIVPGVEVTKPPWMFYWMYALENWWGIPSLLVAPIVLFVLLAIVPLIDRSPWLQPRRRLVIMIAGAVLLLVLIALSTITALTPQVAHVE